MLRFLTLFIGCVALLFGGTCARAEVEATFYSHDFGAYFPHAFVKLKGKVDGTGQSVDTNYGFTAVSTSPAILMGSVKGMIETKDAKYVASSNAHFTIRLSDNDYMRLMALVDKWRNLPGKSYSLNNRNCVHFAMEAAALLGVVVNRKSKFFKKPRSFMVEVMGLNPALKL
jgi:hypothetical protein